MFSSNQKQNYLVNLRGKLFVRLIQLVILKVTNLHCSTFTEGGEEELKNR